MLDTFCGDFATRLWRVVRSHRNADRCGPICCSCSLDVEWCSMRQYESFSPRKNEQAQETKDVCAQIITASTNFQKMPVHEPTCEATVPHVCDIWTRVPVSVVRGPAGAGQKPQDLAPSPCDTNWESLIHEGSVFQHVRSRLWPRHDEWAGECLRAVNLCAPCGMFECPYPLYQISPRPTPVDKMLLVAAASVVGLVNPIGTCGV